MIFRIIDVENNPHISKIRLENLFLLMGRSLEQVNEVKAGNIVGSYNNKIALKPFNFIDIQFLITGISGLQNVVMKTATLSNNLFCPPFVDLPIMAKPILRVAVEPQNTQDMNKLLIGLKLLNQVIFSPFSLPIF